MKASAIRLAVVTTTILAGLQAAPVVAQDLTLPGNIQNQNQFRLLSEDLGSALHYRAQTPAEPLGVLGFDLGVAGTYVELAHASSYNAALDNQSYLVVPAVNAHLGLPLGFDIGASYASGNGITNIGGELRYALLQGGTTMPAIGLRGSLSKMSGVDEMDFNTQGLDLSISKGIAFFTPYAGIGRVWVDSTPKLGAGSTLVAESFSMNKYYLGVGISALLLNLNIEADKTGDATSYSAKVGLRF